MFFKQTGNKTRYSFIDARCIGRSCWAPGHFQHRSPMSGGGSRNTGSPDSPTCLNRAYRGCPEGPEGAYAEKCPEHTQPGDLPPVINFENGSVQCSLCAGTGQIFHVGLPIYQIELAKERKVRGWKKC